VVKIFPTAYNLKFMPVSPARAAAFDILLRVERESSYASELLHSATSERLSTQDHALSTELVMGVLRWQSRLDDEIAQASSHPLAKLDLEILIALRLALYQFRSLDRIPQRAALHESVELVKRARKRSAAPFVNAVLRKLAAAPNAPLAENEPSTAQALARAFAHPIWLIERWVKNYGFETAQEICKYDQSIPKTAIALRDPNAESQLTQAGITVAPGALLASARRVESGDVSKIPAFRRGAIAIQDEASQLVAALVGSTPSKSSRILDCCAAPGGKSLAMAHRNPEAEIIAIELHPHRARLMQERLRNAGSDHIHVVAADVARLPIAGHFDRILADVPCSGTGTLARNPEIKWRLKPDDLFHLQMRQLEILRSVVTTLAQGGRLVYSTCALEREENEDLIEQILREDSSMCLLNCSEELDRLKAAGELTCANPDTLIRGSYLRTVPGIHPCEGFFAAILEKRN
jgi:16S rRNA (cytosine967-C5)-methyltransferase